MGQSTEFPRKGYPRYASSPVTRPASGASRRGSARQPCSGDPLPRRLKRPHQTHRARGRSCRSRRTRGREGQRDGNLGHQEHEARDRRQREQRQRHARGPEAVDQLACHQAPDDDAGADGPGDGRAPAVLELAYEAPAGSRPRSVMYWMDESAGVCLVNADINREVRAQWLEHAIRPQVIARHKKAQ